MKEILQKAQKQYFEYFIGFLLEARKILDRIKCQTIQQDIYTYENVLAAISNSRFLPSTLLVE